MKVSLKNGDISTVSSEEIEAYKKYVTEKYPDEVIDEIILEFEGEDVKIETHKHSTPFIRIRRVSGYLSKITKMNNAKQSEVAERVKHSIMEEA